MKMWNYLTRHEIVNRYDVNIFENNQQPESTKQTKINDLF